MNFLFFAWVASLSYGFVVILTKLTSKYTIANPWYFSFLYGLSILIFTAPVAILNHASIPTQWTDIVLAGFFYGLTNIFFTLALYKLDVTVLGPLFNFRTAFAVLLAFFLLHESLAFWQYILIGIIFIGGVFTTIDETFHIKSFFRWGTLLGLLCMLCLALTGVYTNKAIAATDYWTTSLWMPFIGQIFLLPTIVLFSKAVRKTKPSGLLVMLSVGVLETIAGLSANKAFETNVGLSSVIISLPVSMILAVILSAIWPKLLEKHTVKIYLIRFIAAGVMIVAALRL